jgi:hypothetical protein
VIEMKQETYRRSEFHQGELVTWHKYQGAKCIPVPGVVVRQEAESVLIRTCTDGLIKELLVRPEQLALR